MYKLIIVLCLSLSIISCISMNTNYRQENNCRQKIERHYDTKGHYTGSTWTTVCD